MAALRFLHLLLPLRGVGACQGRWNGCGGGVGLPGHVGTRRGQHRRAASWVTVAAQGMELTLLVPTLRLLRPEPSWLAGGGLARVWLLSGIACAAGEQDGGEGASEGQSGRRLGADVELVPVYLSSREAPGYPSGSTTVLAVCLAGGLASQGKGWAPGGPPGTRSGQAVDSRPG